MAGDKIDIFGKSYYFTAVTNGATQNQNIATLSILTGLLGGPTSGTAAAAHGGVTGTQLNGIDNTTGGILGLFDDQLDEVPNSSAKPRAFINYIFFDEQFKTVKSGFDPVGDKDAVKSHHLSGIAAPKNGYVYIYVSNESPVNVFPACRQGRFDNLQVIHTRGAILEETHYYPYGMKMAGISSKAYGSIKNPYQYQGDYSDFDDETGWNNFELRNYDPQTGRFIQQDPYDQFPSPYTGMGNNPVSNIDEDGGLSIPYLAAITALGAAIGYFAADKEHKWDGIFWDAGIGLGVGLISNNLLNRWLDYANPEAYAQDVYNKYSNGFDRFTIDFKDGGYINRSFDALVNDKLADLFSDSYHFLGEKTNSKYSWITIDRFSSDAITFHLLQIGQDEKLKYYKQWYTPDFIERNYDFRGMATHMFAEIDRNPASSTVDISKNNKLEETLNRQTRTSKKYKIRNSTFRVRYNTGYKTRYVDMPASSNTMPSIDITMPTKINVNIRVKNNRVF
ncbi:MAG: RHS repeat-associated core domain-containing protein [Chitinophagaceae bacterium]|nr:RHS repeat-associated core domain-containing protein [Chitinophagaceae bacterium]